VFFFLVSVCCTVLCSIDRWMMDEDRYNGTSTTVLGVER
jgi:hypothetical protein